MPKKRKPPRLPRMMVAAVDRRELLAFLEAMRRAPELVNDLAALLEKQKRRPRTIPAAPAVPTNGAKAGEA